MTGRSGS